ncbi:MAG: ribonuclease HI family protein [Patescibacteria group bacterium]
MTKLIIYTDGGARGNPGPAGIGVHIVDEANHLVGDYNQYIGETTNNQAEYQAVHLAMEKIKDLGIQEIEFYLDSLLVVQQLNGVYKIKDKNLGVWFVKIWNQKLKYKKISFTHIPREQNKIADKLVNIAIDKALGPQA